MYTYQNPVTLEDIKNDYTRETINLESSPISHLHLRKNPEIIDVQLKNLNATYKDHNFDLCKLIDFVFKQTLYPRTGVRVVFRTRRDNVILTNINDILVEQWHNKKVISYAFEESSHQKDADKDFPFAGVTASASGRSQVAQVAQVAQAGGKKSNKKKSVKKMTGGKGSQKKKHTRKTSPRKNKK